MLYRAAGGRCVPCSSPDLVRTGQAVKKGEVVFEFDPSEQHYKLEQNRSELLQAEQEITKAKADAAVLAAVKTKSPCSKIDTLCAGPNSMCRKTSS